MVEFHYYCIETDRARKHTPLGEPPKGRSSQPSGLARTYGLEARAIECSASGLDLDHHYLLPTGTDEIHLTKRSALIGTQERVALASEIGSGRLFARSSTGDPVDGWTIAQSSSSLWHTRDTLHMHARVVASRRMCATTLEPAWGEEDGTALGRP